MAAETTELFLTQDQAVTLLLLVEGQITEGPEILKHYRQILSGEVIDEE